MSYEVLLVEDEGAASRYLRSIIELKCPDFSVVAVAEDGEGGLQAARRYRPDLVITDIRMPGMDGLEFAGRLAAEMPQVPALIVSGYQEFEYARRALGTGIVEYLLKPVSVRSLVEALEALRPRLEANARKRSCEGLRTALAGPPSPTEAEGAVERSGAARYWIALFREGGLPSRFGADSASGAPDSGQGKQDLVVLQGRDGRERFFLASRESMTFDAFALRVREETGFEERGGEPGGVSKTLVFSSRGIGEWELPELAQDLRRRLDHSIVLGESRISFGSGTAEARGQDWDQVLADRIEYCLANSRFRDMEAAIRDAVASWKAGRRPLIETEAILRKLFHFVRGKAVRDVGVADVDPEYFLETVVAGATDWEDLADASVDLLRRAAGIAEAAATKAGAPAFFGSILRYVDDHYAEALSLGTVSEAFRISQTYMSKLFRKYEGRSFNEYLTYRRIETAKRLMAESPTMPLKDVAGCVGFQDPFYFSRVFKAVTGLPPSEYR